MSDNTSLKELVQNYISEKKQFPDDSTALLTVAGIGTYSDRGSLDFGGSEYTEATIKWLTPQKGAEDDKYGWWHLSEGMYVVQLNETITPPREKRLLLHIWEEAQKAGIVHPSMILQSEGSSGEDTPLRVTVSVGSTGVDIKENARLSKISLL